MMKNLTSVLIVAWLCLAATTASFGQNTLLDVMDQGVVDLAYSPDGRYLVAAMESTAVHIWDLSASRRVHTWEQADDWVVSMAFDPSGTYLATGCWDGHLRVYHWDTRRLVADLPIAWESFYDMQFSPDGTQLLTVTENPNRAVVYDTDTWQLSQEYRLEKDAGLFWTATWSPDGKEVMGGHSSGEIYYWDAETGEYLRMARPHPMVGEVHFSAQGKWGVAANNERDFLYSISLPDGTVGSKIDIICQGNCFGFDFSKDGASMVVIQADMGLIGVIGLENGFPEARTYPVTGMNTATLRPDKGQVAVGFADGSIKLYTVTAGRRLSEQSTLK